jgi:hypothetical protein
MIKLLLYVTIFSLIILIVAASVQLIEMIITHRAIWPVVTVGLLFAIFFHGRDTHDNQ